MKNKINVNISPNPLDLQTLHCSQNDTGERKFYFTLHNNGEVIDTTDISDPIFEPFDVYKDGTEQLLPVNTDDPTTSPIIADIQYPDEEKTEQEFTYRESPTTVDGKALVEKIKGNTIVWNQQCNIIQPTSTINEVTFTNNGDGSWTINGTATANASKLVFAYANSGFYKSNDIVMVGSYGCKAGEYGVFPNQYIASFDGHDFNILNSNFNPVIYVASGVTVNNVVLRPMIFNLTTMFGSTKANEIFAMEVAEKGSGVSYFRSLFPLPYYSYGQKLLSFNGSGIKTVGFNQWDEEWESGRINLSAGANISGNGIRAKNYIHVVPSTVYHVVAGTYGNAKGVVICYYDADKNFVSYEVTGSRNANFTTLEEAHYIRFNIQTSTAITAYNNDICFNISDPSKNGTYEPYKSSTTSIPTLTYFPTGMKRAGNVFDELTNSKAITRIGEVDLGSLSWVYYATANRFYTTDIPNDIKQNTSSSATPNLKCALYSATTPSGTFNSSYDMLISQLEGYFFLVDKSTTDHSVLETKLSGIYLNYELKDEEVTNFTQASLICEDGESTLYQDVDSLVCDCTEDFSKDSGFKDCKIKFTNDDGVVYSNKIELHIERKP